MREIKFRAWNTGIKKMLHFENPLAIMDGEEYGMFLKSVENKMPIGGIYELIQFIGAKDDNDIEIFERDIVHVFGGEYCQGFWEHDEIVEIKDIRDCWWLGEFEHRIVIGNRYENPELIKEAK